MQIRDTTLVRTFEDIRRLSHYLNTFGIWIVYAKNAVIWLYQTVLAKMFGNDHGKIRLKG